MIYAIGCDVSRYNVSFNPDLTVSPVDFAIQKATEGIAYVDLKFDEIWNGVAKVGIRGAYHYQRSGFSWLSQADHFLETTARRDYHIFALDVEEVNNTYSDTFFSDTKRIVDYWRSHSNKKIILYTNGSTYDQMYYAMIRQFGYSRAVEWMNTVPLWLASPAAAGGPFMPKTRTTWDIHQYSWSGLPSRWGTGGTRVDENVYNGDLQAMRAWLGLNTDPEPPQEEEPMNYFKVTAGQLNLRSAGAATAADIGDVYANDVLQCGDAVNGWRQVFAIWRNNAPVALPAPVVWAHGGYMVATTFTPPAPPAGLPDVLWIATQADMSDKREYRKAV